jgi:hypothetical protein
LTKAEALTIFATAIVREILREDAEPRVPDVPRGTPPDEPSGPQPRFDFDESGDVCEHGGIYIPKETCPVHGPGAQEGVTAEELDDMTSDEAPAPIQRARRLAEQNRKRAQKERLFPEDLPMSGLGPPEDLP